VFIRDPDRNALEFDDTKKMTPRSDRR